MRKVWLIVCGVLSVLSLGPLAGAAELGRQPVDASTPVEQNYTQEWFTRSDDPLGVGLEIGLSMNKYSWDIADESFSDAAGAFDAAVLYAVSRQFDIRAAIRYFQTDDEATDVFGSGLLEPDIKVFRFGAGGRFWIPTAMKLYPFATGLINYYGLDGKDLEDIDAGFGASLEAGAAYQMTDAVMVRLSASGETLFTDCQAKLGGTVTDVSFNTVGVGLGVVMLF